MQDLGLAGVIRGTPVRTTIPDKGAPCPLDHVNRVFHALAPNRLWLSDFTDVSTWVGFFYVPFAIDAYARRIVGWRVSRTAHASFVLDRRQPGRSGTARYRELTRACALHLDPEAPSLLTGQLAQLTAEHLLAALIREQWGQGAHGLFVTIAPAANREAWSAVDLYRSMLNCRADGVPFVALALKNVISAIGEDVFDYIGMFYNPRRNHVRNGTLSPVEFE